MSIVESNGQKIIPIHLFETCLADGCTRSEINRKYSKDFVTTKKSCYFLDKFIFHIKKYDLTIIDYCEKYLNINWPKCPKNKTNVGFKPSGKGLIVRSFSKGGVNKENCAAFAKGCEKLSRDRTGIKNPMAGKIPWNYGLTIENPIVKRVSDKLTGRKMSESSKQKMRDKRRESPVKARHVQKHSKETVEKLRRITAERWAKGVFSNRVTSIHLKMRNFLLSLPLRESLSEEFAVKYYSLDFAFPSMKIAIECQGTYYHVDKRKYPNGPIDAIQRRNYGRDIAKRKFLSKLGWSIIECWETEINNDEFKSHIIGELSKANII